MRNTWLLLLFMLFSFASTGQVCDGSFGDNIFDGGDFGSGAAQILPTDPGIAPGYVYITDLPPNDGEYTIVNRMNPGDGFGSWISTDDNSNDPEGYMMVVNATFDPGLFYEEIVEGLCEDVLYEFSADIINMNMSSFTNHILPNVSFLLDDEVVFTTGTVPRIEEWITYGFTFTTAPDQTSIKLSLRNNAPGGIGNDIALDNITFRPCGSTALILPETVQNICEEGGEPFDITATIVGSAFENLFIQWQESFDEGVSWVNLDGETDQDYTFDRLESGDYYFRYLLADSEAKLDNEKCRTNSNTKIVRVLPKFVEAMDSVCTGILYPFGDNVFTTSGIYEDTLQNQLGCDSIVTLDLNFIDQELTGSFLLTPPSCASFTNGSIEILSLSSKGPYDIRINNEPIEEGNLMTDLAAGAYRYTITDRYGCELDTLLSLEDPPIFTVDLGPDQSLVLGEAFQVDQIVSNSAQSYDWFPPDLIDCQPPCESLDVFIPSSVTVFLKATFADSCEARDQVEIIVDEVLEVFIPNVFTPNDDGFNDYVTVYPLDDLNSIEQVEEFVIFNRAGQEVFIRSSFEAGNASLGWDGLHNSSIAPSGIYYYSARIRFINDATRVFAGYIQLIR